MNPMALKYSVVEIYTSEDARINNLPLSDAVIKLMREKKIAGRCMIFKGTGACYENGDIATRNILTLSYNMPVKIDIVLPTAEVDHILPLLTEMVEEGIVSVREMDVRCYKTRNRFIPIHIKVRDVMTRSPEKASLSSRLDEVAGCLLSAIFTGIPVVDEKNRPVGIITQGDLIYRAGMPVRIGLLDASDTNSKDNILAALSQKCAKEVMTQPVVMVHEDDSVTSAVQLMLEKKVKRLPVVDTSGELTGMLSRLDVFQIVARKAVDWDRIKQQRITVDNLFYVKDVMRRDTRTVLPEASVEEVIRIIDTDDIQRIAVVDQNGCFKGMISDRDLLTAFSEHASGIRHYLSKRIPFSEKGQGHQQLQNTLRRKTARDVMEKNLITVLEDTSLDDAVGIMIEKGFKRLPVLDENQVFKGMISRDSLLRTGFAGMS